MSVSRVAVLVAFLLATLPSRAAEGVVGTWQGRYVCNQGETGLTLVLNAGPKQAIDALFYFHAVPSNPSVPDGCFEMSGDYDSGTGQMRLMAGRWLVRPFGYVTVDLKGVVDRARAVISGTVQGPFCTTFEIHRARAMSFGVPPVCRNVMASVGP